VTEHGQEDVFLEVAHARHTDPWTSHAAARSVEDVRESQRHVLECFKEFGSMHHQRLIAVYNLERTRHNWKLQSDQSLRSRCAELVDQGLIRKTDEVVILLPSKRKSIVWEAT
jgi:hypothetical protein